MQNSIVSRIRPALCIAMFLSTLHSASLAAQDGKIPEHPLIENRFYLEVDTALQVYLTGKIARTDTVNTATELYSPQGKTYRKILPAEIAHQRMSGNTDQVAVFYRVRPKETLFRIARLYFDMQIEQLMSLNGLDSIALNIGQELLVGWMDHGADTLNAVTPGSGLQILASPYPEFHDTNTFTPPAIPVMQEKGLALWDKHMQKGAGLIAMHPTARINSTIEIYNPMFDRAVRARVIGNIPENRYPADVSIIVSPEVAETLGVLDRRFYVILRYYE